MANKSQDSFSQAPLLSTTEEHNIYLFMTHVNDETCKDLISFIITKNLITPKPKYLQLIINSGGGDLNAAFAVIDIMRGSPIPVYTTGLGMVGSAAFAMFIAGKKGYRILTPNTSIQNHTEIKLYRIMKSKSDKICIFVPCTQYFICSAVA